jgi:hypothetical protein
MKIDLSDIARGRRIVAVAAKEMERTRSVPRPPRLGLIYRLIRRILG